MEMNGLAAAIFLSFISLTIFIALLIFKTINKRKTMNKKRLALLLPPGPKPWPIVGCLFQILRNKPTYKWIHKLMNDLNTEIVCIRVAGVHVIVVTSPELACEFLKKHDANFSSRPLCTSAEMISNGYRSAVLSPFGDQWKKMRRIVVSEVLSLQKHHWLQNKRIEEADHLVHYVYNLCMCNVQSEILGSEHDNMSLIGGLVNVRLVARYYCGNVIRRIIFNKRFFGKGSKDGGSGFQEEEHVSALFTILDNLYAFWASDYMPWLKIFDIGNHQKIIQKSIQTITKYQDPEIDERVDMWKHGLRKEQQDILDVLITLKDAQGQPLLATQDIKAQINELMLATIDNPSNVVEWALAEMLNQPDILQKACDELDKVVGRERLVQEFDLPRLNYIKACAKEAFRLHPTQAFNPPHVALSDANVVGYFIPKGSHVLISRSGLGRNSKVWDDPLIFKPDRHTKDDNSEVVLADPELRILSFSTGRRGCPGILLGSTTTVMLLARLLHGFYWSLPPGVSTTKLKENNFLLANPLIVVANPRLPKNVYPLASNHI